MNFQEIKKHKYIVEFVINDKRYAVSTDELKHAIKDVEIWQQCGGTYFTIKLNIKISKIEPVF